MSLRFDPSGNRWVVRWSDAGEQRTRRFPTREPPATSIASAERPSSPRRRDWPANRRGDARGHKGEGPGGDLARLRARIQARGTAPGRRPSHGRLLLRDQARHPLAYRRHATVRDSHDPRGYPTYEAASRGRNRLSRTRDDCAAMMSCSRTDSTGPAERQARRAPAARQPAEYRFVSVTPVADRAAHRAAVPRHAPPPRLPRRASSSVSGPPASPAAGSGGTNVTATCGLGRRARRRAPRPPSAAVSGPPALASRVRREPPASVVTVVRLARPQDAPSVAALLHDFNVEFSTPTPGVAVLAARLETLLGGRATLALLAGDPAIGLALITLRENVWYDGPVALVDELYVRPDARARGTGTALMERAF